MKRIVPHLLFCIVTSLTLPLSGTENHEYQEDIIALEDIMPFLREEMSGNNDPLYQAEPLPYQHINRAKLPDDVEALASRLLKDDFISVMSVTRYSDAHQHLAAVRKAIKALDAYEELIEELAEKHNPGQNFEDPDDDDDDDEDDGDDDREGEDDDDDDEDDNKAEEHVKSQPAEVAPTQAPSQPATPITKEAAPALPQPVAEQSPAAPSVVQEAPKAPQALPVPEAPQTPAAPEKEEEVTVVPPDISM